MKKKLAVILIFVIAFVSLAQGVGAINVIMNSSFVTFPDQEPVIENGTTLVPIRTIAELLGLEVSWDDPTDTVTIKKDNFFISLVIGSTKAKTSAGEKTLLVAPKIINGRTMVPLRFIAEELGLKVKWNDEYQRIVIAGEIDTQKVVQLPKEEPTETGTDIIEDATGIEITEESSEDLFVAEDVGEDECRVEMATTVAITNTSVITFEFPLVYTAEDTDLENEETFFYRSLDAFDAQHKYNWEIATQYECYVDESGQSGFMFVVQSFEDENTYDVSILEAEYPEPPEQPQRPEYPEEPEEYTMVENERQLLGLKQMYEDVGVEFPEDLSTIYQTIMSDLGYEDPWELRNAIEEAVELVDASQLEGYDVWLAYKEETQAIRDEYNAEREIYNEDKKIYDEECANINNGKEYVFRHYAEFFDKLTEEQWIEFISSQLNTDEEVRYESIEFVEIGKKKAIHAIIFAEDPDDEQGVYDYYYYSDGSSIVTIFGGTLFGSEPSQEIVDVLANMTIE